ncbi:DUF7838 family putative zinc beta-ribbon protein [Halosimplex marinum]|jgi:rubredoxin|uniref:DUF7838 family putative zinc beta-ribbon protein n=1 Tax=Halosimplex marinum TaxID=3396620 RepID=UPI003F548C1D
MSEVITHECPNCDAEKEFYQAASMQVHIGEKVKWHCWDCDYGFVRIDETVDTSKATA